MKKERVLNIIGIILLVIGIASLSRIFFPATTWQNVFWWCDHATIILGLAILFRNRFWLTAELNIALIPQFLWSIDFFGKVFFNKFVFGFTAYMFEGHWAFKLLSYQHLFVFILALVALFMMGTANPRAWFGSLIHGVFLFIAGLLIAASYNINCVHKNCLNFHSGINYHVVWFILFISMVLITNFILVKITKLFKQQKYLKKNARRNKKTKKRR